MRCELQTASRPVSGTPPPQWGRWVGVTSVKMVENAVGLEMAMDY